MSPLSPPTSREQWRREMRILRRALDPAQRQQAAAALVETVTGLAEFRNAVHIAVYMAMDGEIDPAPLAARARETGKQLYLPVLVAETLRFAAWHPDTLLYPNRFKIPEPRPPLDELHSPAELDLVLTPLVAFDAQGNRLGMGGGYYDRSFAFLKAGMHKPLLIGLAYEFQHLPSLSVEPWDVPLAGVATDCAFYRFRD
ncbi:MAG TPA: 5-formyltetrahydrofolate cyclo-ligase [Gammaproteobacteria bacterium]